MVFGGVKREGRRFDLKSKRVGLRPPERGRKPVEKRRSQIWCVTNTHM